MELFSDKDVSKYRSIRSFNDWVWEKNDLCTNNKPQDWSEIL